MALSELEQQRVEKIVGAYCREKIPPHVRDKIKVFYTIRGSDVKVVESRPHWQGKGEWTEMEIARIKYDASALTWQLYWKRANGRWIKYPDFKPVSDLKKIVNEIEADPHYVFWG
ncbi:MAG: DUF3024 domain-containing protein [Deltaproteobacteria bacterium]|nr:DUF3024 domain-containing protein [Deltaproteobacteria bacterium]